MTRRAYAGGVSGRTLTGPVTDIATSFPVSSIAGMPNGSSGFFAVRVGRGLPNEEKMLISSASGGVLTVNQRGYDGTTARTHNAGESVELVITAIDADEANAHVNTSQGVHGLAAGVPLVGTTTSQVLSGKTMDGGANTFTNIPWTAVPAGVSALAAEAAARTAADALRYLKTEADAAFAPINLPQALVDAHEADPDPHPQYLFHDGTAARRLALARLPLGSAPMLSGRNWVAPLTDLVATDASPIRTLGTLSVTANGTGSEARLIMVMANIVGFQTNGADSDLCRFKVEIESNQSAWLHTPSDPLQGPAQQFRQGGNIAVSTNGCELVGLFVAGQAATPQFTLKFSKLSGTCNPEAVCGGADSFFQAVQLT